MAAAFFLCRTRGEAHEHNSDYKPLREFICFAIAEGIYILIMLLTGGRTFSTIINIYACMAITGESTTNEAIRDNHAQLLAGMIFLMNIVPLPFAYLGFYSGKKKRMNERAGFTHNTMNG